MTGKKDYYLILDVARDESPHGIRKAFRRLAKISHPDRAGLEGTSSFREIAEAYGVLSDPESRRRYDASLQEPVHGPTPASRAWPPRGSTERSPEPPASGFRRRPRYRREPEPLVPETRYRPGPEPLVRDLRAPAAPTGGRAGAIEVLFRLLRSGRLRFF